MEKTSVKVPRPEPSKGKSLKIPKVLTQIIHLDSRPSEVVKNRLITASSPIHAAQSTARPKITTGTLETLCLP